MNVKEKILVFLSTISEVSLRKKRNIFETIGNNINELANFLNELKICKNFLSESEYNVIIKKYSPDYVEKLVDFLEKEEIGFISILDQRFCEKLISLQNDMPLCLFYKGDIDLMFLHSIGVVGSRKFTYYGEKVTKDFVNDLVDMGFVITSGLADGIDSVAHKKCLECNGKTIAVIAGGLKHIYPSSNIKLFGDICRHGLVVSENYPTVVPRPYMFPVRNRIISALCDCVLVTEAREKSGALITCRLAIEQGKEVCAVCGNINSASSKGCNNLIRSGGAHFVTCALDVLESVGIDAIVENKISLNTGNDEVKKQSEDLAVSDCVERVIIDLLEFKESSFDEILIKTGLDAKELSQKLFIMELDGKLRKLPANYYAKI